MSRVLPSAALALTTAVAAIAGSHTAEAQSTAPPASQPVHSSPYLGIAQAAERAFDIPTQPLNQALVEFGRQAGMSASADASLTQNQRSAPVKGTMTWQQALTTLLAGTGLTYRLNGSIVTLERTPGVGTGALQLDPVQVPGVFPVPSQAMIDNLPPAYAGGQVATGGQLGLLGNRPVMDTPFNQSNYTAKKAQDQQAKTVLEVLIDDPSVRPAFADGSAGSDSMNIRGFAVNAEATAYGGLYGMLPSISIMSELAERVEVLKGPSAMLNGMPPGFASIGGTINIVPKRAPDEPLTQLTANYISAGQVGGHADIARRFGPDKQFGVRFNGVFRSGQTEVEDNTDQRALGVLGLDFRGERARLSADLGYQYRNIGGLIPYLLLPAGIPVPWTPNARSNWGQPWGSLETKDLFGVFRAEFDVTERITAYAAFGAHDYRVGIYAPLLNFISNFDGTSTATPGNFSNYATYLTADAGLRARLETGPIGHELALTATTLASEVGEGAVFGTSFTTNIYSTSNISRPIIAAPNTTKTSTQALSSFGLADTLSAADKRIQLTVGARLQQVTATNFNPTTGAQTSNYDQGAFSPSVSLVFKPWENVSVYGNWIQGLQQGTVVGPQFANAGEVFAPFKSTQYEAGVKVDWGKFTTTASVFQISQPSTIATPGSTLPTLTLNGEQRNQGIEINVFGEPIDGVRLLGGAMFLSPVLTKTQEGLNDGWIAPGTPQVTLNLLGEWDLPFVRGLTLNGRMIYTGSQYIDTTWPRRSLPAWTRFDLGMRYTFDNPAAKGKPLVARFEVDNVLDANYWAAASGPPFLAVGAPRTFRLSLTADF